MASKSYLKWIVPAAAIMLVGLTLTSTSCKPNPESSIKPEQSDQEIAAAMREIAGVRATLEKAPPEVVANYRSENIYKGSVTLSVDAGHRVIFYSNVPKQACIALMRQLSGSPGVDALGIEGQSPGWRENVTNEIAVSDCVAATNKINIRLK